VISVLVTLFSSIGSFFLDFLFIEILSAPTADSIKISNHNSTSSSSLGLKDTPGSALSLSRMKRSVKNKNIEREVRIVSPELIEAHSEAVRSFGQVFNEKESVLKIKNERTNRMTRLGSAIDIRAPSPASPLSSESERAVAAATGGGSSDVLLTSLLCDMKDERNQMKRVSERENFDSVWG
jgi:hypothetical protein